MSSRLNSSKVMIRMTKKLVLSQGQHALVDECDHNFLNQWKWTSHYEPKIRGYYAKRTQTIHMANGKTKRKTIMMHRVIMGRIIKREVKKTEIIDHINHNSLDNTRENLRIVTNRQNTQNKRIKGTSKYPGVYWHKLRNKWVAKIRIKSKQKYLGLFTDEREAAKAYEKACRELVGEELVCKLNSKTREKSKEVN